MNFLFSALLVLLFLSSSAFAKIQMAVTVDDLPLHGKLPAGTSRIEIAKSILATLHSNHVPEVYGFINARHLEQDKDLTEVLNLWVMSGYPLGNHTYSHPHLNSLSVEDFNKEIEADESTLKAISSKFDWHYFRYPFLDEGENLEKRNAVRAYLKKNNYKIAYVTDEFEDWAWNDPYARCKSKNDQKSIQHLADSYTKAASDRFLLDGEILNAIYHRPVARILLLHIGAFDAQMLPTILKMYKDKGVEFIPLSVAVKDPIYSEDLGLAMGGNGDFEYNAMKAKNLTTEKLGLGHGWKFPGQELDQICKD